MTPEAQLFRVFSSNIQSLRETRPYHAKLYSLESYDLSISSIQNLTEQNVSPSTTFR